MESESVSQGDVMAIFQEAIMTALKLAAPLLLVSIVIGLIVAIFQAATQIQEQTLTFVPKVLAIGLMLLVFGSWMITTLTGLLERLIGYAAIL